jgi:heme a synthase
MAAAPAVRSSHRSCPPAPAPIVAYATGSLATMTTSSTSASDLPPTEGPSPARSSTQRPSPQRSSTERPPTDPPASDERRAREAREFTRLRRAAWAALATNVMIVFTGGIVRVTGSGLGCPDWPRCDGASLTPTLGAEGQGWHELIEFGNRLLTFVVLAAAVAVFVQVRRTRPHERLVEAMAWMLPLGVLAQALLGGITVLTGLSPVTVAAHFLLSMVLIAAATVLVVRVRPPAPATPPARSLQHATTALLVVAAAVLVLGTFVTGAVPHGGDATAPRFAVDIRDVARLHAVSVWVLVGLTVALLVATSRTGQTHLRGALVLLLGVEIAQGALGYTQYALGVPAGLVAGHILGAALMWATAVAVWIRARPPRPDSPTLRSVARTAVVSGAPAHR